MRSVEFPNALVPLLIAVNVAVFALCVGHSGTATIPSAVLLRYGAMYSQIVDRGEYWRFITYGFLHANPLHIATNMLCLFVWGSLLEKRLGSFYFAMIYVCGLIVGGITSYVTHPGAYLSVGASAAISAVLGALLCLRILGRIDLAWNFFVVNVGVNVALAAGFSSIDWQAHLGGFVTGMVSCAILDLVEQVLPWVLRCKFPEFVKLNLLLVLAAVVAYVLAAPMAGASHQNLSVFALAVVIAGLVLIKALDLVLSIKKGLSVIVVACALTNAALVLLLRNPIATALASLCAARPASDNAVATMICTDIDVTIGIVAAAAFVVTMLALWPAFARGLSDVGFVGASLRGERNRRHGL